MEYKYINIKLINGIAKVIINRPEVRNAMNKECWSELNQFIIKAENDNDIQVIIITGAGSKAFVAGADIKELKERTFVESIGGVQRAVLRRIENMKKVVIAMVNGIAVGGGFELALACDIRIISKNSKFSFPETNLGIIPGLGGTQRLSRLIGLGRAKEVILADRVIDSDEAVQMGLVYKAVESDKLEYETMLLAKLIQNKGPIAISLAKTMLNSSCYIDIESGLYMENLAFAAIMNTEDKKEGIDAFINKRKPNFKGK